MHCIRNMEFNITAKYIEIPRNQEDGQYLEYRLNTWALGIIDILPKHLWGIVSVVGIGIHFPFLIISVTLKFRYDINNCVYSNNFDDCINTVRNGRQWRIKLYLKFEYRKKMWRFRISIHQSQERRQ